MTIDLDELKRILEMAREHDLSELELERDGFKIRIKKGEAGPAVAAPAPRTAAQPGGADTGRPPIDRPQSSQLQSDQLQSDQPEADGIELAVVKSPIVGTFFRAPEPGARSFVEVGDSIKKGQVLCIIEAMKLMNEIESEYAGEVVSVYVENGQPVQYGERLFAIKALD
jgi:acetyl-CoA carboxylase biotin carboxyl carrier protein